MREPDPLPCAEGKERRPTTKVKKFRKSKNYKVKALELDRNTTRAVMQPAQKKERHVKQRFNDHHWARALQVPTRWPACLAKNVRRRRSCLHASENNGAAMQISSWWQMLLLTSRTGCFCLVVDDDLERAEGENEFVHASNVLWRVGEIAVWRVCILYAGANFVGVSRPCRVWLPTAPPWSFWTKVEVCRYTYFCCCMRRGVFVVRVWVTVLSKAVATQLFWWFGVTRS